MTDPETIAYHEAGHAFMAIYVGARVRSVMIEPDWDDGPERYADIRVEWPTIWKTCSVPGCGSGSRRPAVELA